MTDTKHDYEAIAKTIVEDHTTYCKGTDKEHVSYEPCYFDQGFSDTNEEIMSAFISGEEKDGFPVWRELADNVMQEWESDCIWEDAKELTNQYEKDEGGFPDDFDECELRDSIRDALGNANTQDVQLEWVKDMRQPIVRFHLDDGDDPEWTENDDDMTPELLCNKAGIERSEKNLKAADVIIANAYYPGCWRSLYVVFRMDIPKDNEGDKVHIKGEVELWACNPYAGDGMADTVDIDITVDRSRLSTDKEAPGYSYNEVFGPHIPSIPEPDVTFINTKVEA